MPEMSEVSVVFGFEGSACLADDLAQFLASLDVAYEGALHAVSDETPTKVLSSPHAYFPAVLDYFFRGPSIRVIPHERSLRIRRLAYNSPLEIAFVGLSSALIVALTLAGGEVKALGATVKIQKSLGESLKDLRHALRTPHAPRMLSSARPASKSSSKSPRPRLRPAAKKLAKKR